jgi:hypothetical protein
VHAVLGLVPDHGLRAVDDLGRDLFAAVRRQAVHEERVGLRHAIIICARRRTSRRRPSWRASFSAS